MIYRLAAVYVRLLFAIGLSLFASALLMHAIEIFLPNRTSPFMTHSKWLFFATWIVVLAITPFRKKENWKWVSEIKQCPGWMWKSALGFGIYTFVVAVTVLLSGGGPGPEIFSAFLIAFNAINVCLLYASISSETANRADLVRRTRNSLITVIAAVTLLVLVFGNHLPLRVKVS